MGMDAARHLHHSRPIPDFLMGEVQVVEKRRTKATRLEAQRQREEAVSAPRDSVGTSSSVGTSRQEAVSAPRDANIRQGDKEMLQATVTHEPIAGAATTEAVAARTGAVVKCSLVLLSSQVG